MAGAILTLFLASLIAFFLVSALPGNTARNLLGPDATAEQVTALERQLGLDQPVSRRYFNWLLGIARGDFGQSLASGQSVTTLLSSCLLVTGALVGYVFALVVPASILTATLAARWPGGLMAAAFRGLSTAGLAMAPYIVAMILVLLFAVYLRILPSFGYTEPSRDFSAFVRSMTLPAASLALPLWSLYSRFLANDLIVQLQSKEYIWAAEARGIRRWRIILHHALRSSLGALLSIIGLHLSSLLAGAVVIEQIFGLPGVGRLLLDAVELRDMPVIQAIVIWAATITIASTFLADTFNTLLDPRTRNA